MYSGIPDLYNNLKYAVASPATSSVMVNTPYASDDQLVPCSNNLYSYSPAPTNVPTSNLTHPAYSNPLIDYAPINGSPSMGAPAFSQGGFMPPVVDPMQTVPSIGGMYGNQSQMMYGRETVVNINPAKIPANPPRKGGRKPKTNKLPPAEEEKRRVRRLRNKLAASKCRQRRMDHTLTLVGETDHLEDEQSHYEQEIARLKQIKEHYEYVLSSHSASCSKSSLQQGSRHSAVCSSSASLTNHSSATVMTNVTAGSSNCSTGSGPMSSGSTISNGSSMSNNRVPMSTAGVSMSGNSVSMSNNSIGNGLLMGGSLGMARGLMGAGGMVSSSRTYLAPPRGLTLQTSCADSFRRSSSSDGDLQSPLLAL